MSLRAGATARCAVRGVVSWGKTRQVFIGHARRRSVRERVANYHRVEHLLDALSELFCERLRDKRG